MLPSWLYELLPYIYVLSGAGAMMWVGGVATLSGFVLILAGLLVFHMRLSSRS